MKRFFRSVLVESILIAAISLGVAMAANAVRRDGLPLARSYQPRDELTEQAFTRVSRVDLETLKALIQAEMVVVLDIRDKKSFRSGHIPGAKNLPLDREESAIVSLLEESEAGRTIVICCSDPACLDAASLAARLLQREAYDLMIFPGGIKAWKADGMPLETGGGGF